MYKLLEIQTRNSSLHHNFFSFSFNEFVFGVIDDWPVELFQQNCIFLSNERNNSNNTSHFSIIKYRQMNHEQFISQYLNGRASIR